MKLSIVIPLYNEGASVGPLCEAIVDALDPLPYDFEAVLVDDGSEDETFERASAAAGRDERFRVVGLSDNFGQTAALHAGIAEARGEIVVTMDGDLQNDPRDIGRLVEEIEAGYDVVAGYRADRKDRWLSRKLPSRAGNWLIRQVTGTPIIDNGCALRAYRAEVIKDFPLYSEMHRLLPTILALTGCRIRQIPVRHHPRRYGESKYGLGRVYKVLIDLLALKTVLTAARLPLFGFGGFAVASASLGALAVAMGTAQLVVLPESSIVVYLGVAMLWGSLSLSLLVLGALASMIYTMGDLKIDDLLEVKAVQRI